MSEGEVYAGLTEIFREAFFRDDLVVTPYLSASDVPGWDSFKMIEILMAAEERFGVKFTTREIDGLARVGQLAELIARKAA